MAMVAEIANWGESMPIEASMLRNWVRMLAWDSTTRTCRPWGRSIGASGIRGSRGAQAIPQDYGMARQG
ncbi:hypothetical protein MASR2M50_05380 [Thauera sp.]